MFLRFYIRSIGNQLKKFCGVSPDILNLHGQFARYLTTPQSTSHSLKLFFSTLIDQ